MGEEFSQSTLEHFLSDQQEILQHDKLSLARNMPAKASNKSPNLTQPSDHNGKPNIVARNNSQFTRTTVNQSKESRMVRSTTTNHIALNSREIEKDKLINLLSKPQTNQSITNKKSINKTETLTKTSKNTNFRANDREKEKDRLAEILSSSGYQYQKPSNYQISKNLNSEFGLKSNKESFHSTYFTSNNSGFDQFKINYETKNTKPIAQDKLVSGHQRQTIPNILVSEFERNDNINTDPEEKTMVRIGEYSPLNPNVPPSRPELGVGEYDERRRVGLEQRRQEYNQYLQQVEANSRYPSPFQHNSVQIQTCQHRDIATQTEWGLETIPSEHIPPRPCSVEPHAPRSYSVEPPAERRVQQYCTSSTERLSPLPRCFAGLSEKEVKENLYREELRKQIEEKNRLKEEEREKEEEEDAKIDAKIQKDLEKMRRQFEEERLQRLELAIRRKEQDDLLRQRLAADQRSFQDKKKQLLINKSTSPREPSTRRPVGSKFTERQTVTPLNHSPSITCAAKALNDVHEVLRQPLIEIQDQLPTPTVSSEQYSAVERRSTAKPSTSSQPVRKVKDKGVIVRRTAHEPTAVSSSREVRDPSPSLHAGSVNEKIREVNAMLKRPLLTESFQTLPPMSPPLLHASVPPPTSTSPPIPTCRRVQRTDSEPLEERWKVPLVEQYNAAPSDVLTMHSGSVLTQLGAFRRSLLQERMRMRQRVRDESP